MSTNRRPIVIDLFSGVGGLSLGFENAGFDIAASVEIDPIHSAVHSYNFPNCTSICADVRDLTGESILKVANIPVKKKIDVIVGGSPCQGFSMIGKRDKNDPRNELIWQFVRLVIDLKPKYFVLENVTGLTVGNTKCLLEKVIEKFKKNGFSVLEDWQILNAANFGVPQNRRRLFLLGARSGQKLPQYPKPIYSLRGRSKVVDGIQLPPGPSVLDAIGDLPNVDEFEILLEQNFMITEFDKPSKYVRKLNSVKYGYSRKYNPKLMTCCSRTIHSESTKRRFRATEPGETEPISRFYKLDAQGLCNTLRAGTGNDRGSFMAPRPIHCHFDRCITVREAARLHSYPDWFQFHQTKWHAMRQIGNSVPPLLAQAVAEEIIAALNVIPQKPGKSIISGEQGLLRSNAAQSANFFDFASETVGTKIRSRSKVK